MLFYFVCCCMTIRCLPKFLTFREELYAYKAFTGIRWNYNTPDNVLEGRILFMNLIEVWVYFYRLMSSEFSLPYLFIIFLYHRCQLSPILKRILWRHSTLKRLCQTKKFGNPSGTPSKKLDQRHGMTWMKIKRTRCNDIIEFTMYFSILFCVFSWEESLQHVLLWSEISVFLLVYNSNLNWCIININCW